MTRNLIPSHGLQAHSRPAEATEGQKGGTPRCHAAPDAAYAAGAGNYVVQEREGAVYVLRLPQLQLLLTDAHRLRTPSVPAPAPPARQTGRQAESEREARWARRGRPRARAPAMARRQARASALARGRSKPPWSNRIHMHST